MSDQAEGPGWWQASDGKWYPPQPAAAAPPPPPPPSQLPSQPVGYGHAAPPPPKSGPGCLKIGLIVLAVLVVLGIGLTVILAVAVNDAVDDHNEQQEAARDDVEVNACSTDTAGFMQAELRVTNHSSERSNYTIEVSFEAPDGDQIDTGFATVSALESEQSTSETAVTFTEPEGEFTCRVTDVTRFSDE